MNYMFLEDSEKPLQYFKQGKDMIPFQIIIIKKTLLKGMGAIEEF